MGETGLRGSGFVLDESATLGRGDDGRLFGPSSSAPARARPKARSAFASGLSTKRECVARANAIALGVADWGIEAELGAGGERSAVLGTEYSEPVETAPVHCAGPGQRIESAVGGLTGAEAGGLMICAGVSGISVY